MRTALRLLLVATLFTPPLLLSGCMTQKERTARLESRQDRMDSRTAARQERWRIRGEREDARAEARFNSW